MKVNKILTTGLILATTMSAQSSPCGKGGIYCELGVGATITTMKYKNDAPAQDSVLDVAKIAKKHGVDPTGKEIGNTKIKEYEAESGRIMGLMYPSKECIGEDNVFSDVSAMKVIKKKKALPQVDFTLGADFVKGRGRFGIDVSFEHKFGKSSKTVNGLNMNGKYVDKTTREQVTEASKTEEDKDYVEVYTTKQIEHPAGGLIYSLYNIAVGDSIERVSDIYDPEVYDSQLDAKITQKNRLNISIMTKIGLIATKAMEFYGTVGIVITSNNYKISFPNLRSKADECIKKTVTKVVPRVGFGAIINLKKPGTYVRIGYYYTFKAKGTKKTEYRNMTNTFETSDQLIRIGIGKRF